MRAVWLLSVSMTVVAAPASAQSQQLMGLPHEIHVGPGDQSDPHVSGGLVTYTSALDGASEIRVHRLDDGHNEAIPTGGALDLLSDISGTTLAFTRLSGAKSAIMTLDVVSGGAAREVAPVPDANRRRAVLGGPTIAWLDHGLGGSTGRPVVAAVTDDEQVATALSDATGLHRDPAVSPDGQVVVWTRCEQDGSGCAILQARRSQGGWTQTVLASLGESSQPDSSGELVVYAAARAGSDGPERDIYWQPVGGGPERRLALEGDDANPNVSGRFIAFERRDPAGGGAADIVLYDLDAGWLYQLTETEEGESLNDVSVTSDGTVNVVWTVPGAAGLDVRGMTLRLPGLGACTPTPTGCDDPWNRALLAELVLDRSCGPKERRRAAFSSAAAGEGILCATVGTGARDVTAAWVWVDDNEVLGPRDFKTGVSRWERAVELSAGEGTLSATLAGRPGSGLALKLFGPPTCPTHHPVGRSRLWDHPGSLQPVPGRPVLPSEGASAVSELLPGDAPGMTGCSAGGTGAMAWALVLLALALGTARPRTLVRLRVRRRRR